MKTIFLFSFLFCLIALPVLGETSEDTVKTDIAVIKTEIKNLNEKIDDKFESINSRFEGINGKFESKRILTDKITSSLPASVFLWRFLLSVRLYGVSWRTDGVEKTAPSKNKLRRLHRKSKRSNDSEPSTHNTAYTLVSNITMTPNIKLCVSVLASKPSRSKDFPVRS